MLPPSCVLTALMLSDKGHPPLSASSYRPRRRSLNCSPGLNAEGGREAAGGVGSYPELKLAGFHYVGVVGADEAERTDWDLEADRLRFTRLEPHPNKAFELAHRARNARDQVAHVELDRLHTRAVAGVGDAGASCQRSVQTN